MINKHKSINLNKQVMKALKAINSISVRKLTDDNIKKHRKVMERLGHFAASKADVNISSFTVGDIACEMIRPKSDYDSRYSVMYAHGGGYICGGLGYARILASKLAVATGFTTYSFDYRLAPEHPYPAALNDGMAVWEHLTGDKDIADNIIMAGDSAGGNLVLCMAQQLLAQNRSLPVGLLLFSPWTDMTATSGSYDTYKELDPILTKDYVTDASRVYIPDGGSPEDYRFSPLYGEFENMPPVYIMAGRNEILLDDSISLRDRIVAAGSKATLDIEENGWHVYQQMPVPIAGQAMNRLAAYVASELAV